VTTAKNNSNEPVWPGEGKQKQQSTCAKESKRKTINPDYGNHEINGQCPWGSLVRGKQAI